MPFNIAVKLALGADPTASPTSWTWTTITSYVRLSSGIALARGRGDQDSDVGPSRLALTLDNTDGRFCIRNPVGAWYGLLNRNTPIRVTVDEVTDTFDRTVADGFGATDTEETYTLSGTASDYDVTSGVATIQPTTLSNDRLAYFTAGQGSDRTMQVDGKFGTLPATANLRFGLILRMVDTSNTYTAQLQTSSAGAGTIQLFKRIAGSQTNLGSVALADPVVAGAWWTLRAEVQGSEIRAKAWLVGDSEPLTWQVTATDTALPTGTLAGLIARNESAATTHVMSYDNLSSLPVGGIRYTGFVDQWPPRFDPSYREQHVPITASGLLRRVGQGQGLRSALYRAHAIQAYSASPAPRAYWPCEDQAGALTIASGIGATPMSYVNCDLGSDSSIAGSDPLMVLGTLAGFSGSVPTHSDTGAWAVRCVLKIPSAPAGTVYPFGWYCNGTLNPWRFAIVPGSPDRLRVEAFNSAGTEVLSMTGIDLETGAFGSLYDRTLYVEFTVTQDGTAIDWDLSVWSSGGEQAEVGTEASVTTGTVTGVALTGSAGATGVTVGHISVWDTDFNLGILYLGATGFAGDTTAARFIRLCAEADIPYDNPTVVRLTYMGEQGKSSMVELLREVEAAESGLMYERTDGTLALLLRTDRENRDVEFALDFDQGHIVPPFEPTEDDFGLLNDVEVTVEGGSSGRYTDLVHVAANGPYDDRISLNLDPNVEDPLLHASWRVHLGTAADARYPAIAFKLHGSPELFDDWLGCDIGSRITIDNPPVGLPPDLIDVHLEGYSEYLTPTVWDVLANCSPAGPWQVASVEDGLMADTTSQLLVGYDGDDTSLLIAHPTVPHGLIVPPYWNTLAEPYDWNIAGEQVTATAVTTNATSFVNAGTAAHADNASVTPGMPASVTKGDLLLVYAAIRSSGTGTVDTPDGYEVMLAFGNIALFAKSHTGTESAPTITFSGGVSGDTCSAQMAAFRHARPVVDASSTLLNASAQNIDYPGLNGVSRNNLLLIFLGWKQDDWTSSSPHVGTNEIGDTSSALGNDQGITWAYQIQTVALQYPVSGVFTITGGAPAISRSSIIALVADVQTATVTRNVNAIPGGKSHTAGTAVSLWRPSSLAL